MEILAKSLDIPKSSRIYLDGLDLYNRLRQLDGRNRNFTELCVMASCLKLSSDRLAIQLDGNLTARRAATTISNFQACLEYIAASIGGLVTLESLCTRCGWPSVLEVANGVLRELEKIKGQIEGSVMIAAILYITMQALGIRCSLASIASAAYANHQHVQRCSLELKSIISPFLNKISEDEELIRKIKSEGKKNPKLSKAKHSDALKTPVPVVSMDDTPRLRVNQKLPKLTRTLEQEHYLSEFGYSIFSPHRIPQSDAHWNQIHQFVTQWNTKNNKV